MTGISDSERRLARLESDHHAGATALTRRAAEAVRQRLAEDAGLAGLEEFADRLADAQPAMAPIRNLAERVQSLARQEQPPDAIRAAIDRCEEELAASPERIAHRAIGLLPRSGRLMTISASATVAETLIRAHEQGHALHVHCPESRPLCEGTSLAATLADQGLAATICADALAPSFVQELDLVLVGGDTLAPEGLLNKIGTFGLALAAQHAGVPFVALLSQWKVRERVDDAGIRAMPTEELCPDLAPSERLAIVNRYFDRTPRTLLSYWIHEAGIRKEDRADAGPERAG